MRYVVAKPETYMLKSGFFARKKEDEKFQQSVFVIYKLDEFIYLLEVMNSVYDIVVTDNPICSIKSDCIYLIFIIFLSFRVRMSWNIGDNRNLFLKLKSKLGLYHVLLTTPKTFPEKLSLTVVEMQQLPDMEKTDAQEEISCLKWTVFNGRRKVRVNFNTDTDKLNNVVYRYRNNLYLKDNEIDLKLTEYQ